MARISSSVRDAASSMVSSVASARSGWVAARARPGLGLDGDGRHVMADRVVQLAGELVALAEFGLLDVADAGVGVVADRGAQRGGEAAENRKNPYPATTSVVAVGSATWVMASQARMTPRPIAASRPAPQRNSE